MIFAGWGKVARDGSITSLVLVNLLYTLAFTGMETVFALLTQKNFGWHATQNGYIFTYIGVIIVLMQGGLVRQLVKHFGERNLMLSGLVLLGCGLILLIYSTNVGFLLLAVAILAIGDGAVTPTSSAVLSLLTSASEQGEVLGFAQGIGGLGRIFGPLIAGILFAVSPNLPFLVGGLFSLLAIVVTVPVMTTIQTRIAAHHQTSTPDLTMETHEASVSRR